MPGRVPGTFAYVDQSDQRVWLCDGPDAPHALSAPAADGTVHRHGGLAATADGHWVLAVRETVPPASDGPPRRSVVALSTGRGAPVESTLLDGQAGHDFFGAPRVDQSSARLAVVTWAHPDMPWDASRLVVLPLRRGQGARSDGTAPVLEPAGEPWLAAGGADESVGQPAWQRDGSLRFVSDRRGWWQPYVHPGSPDATPVDALLSDVEAEYHGPDWVLGQSTLAELPDGTIVARQTASGRDTVVHLRPGGAPETVAQPCVSIAGLCAHGDAWR